MHLAWGSFSHTLCSSSVWVQCVCADAVSGPISSWKYFHKRHIETLSQLRSDDRVQERIHWVHSAKDTVTAYVTPLEIKNINHCNTHSEKAKFKMHLCLRTGKILHCSQLSVNEIWATEQYNCCLSLSHLTDQCWLNGNMHFSINT